MRVAPSAPRCIYQAVRAIDRVHAVVPSETAHAGPTFCPLEECKWCTYNRRVRTSVGVWFTFWPTGGCGCAEIPARR